MSAESGCRVHLSPDLRQEYFTVCKVDFFTTRWKTIQSIGDCLSVVLLTAVRL